MEAKKRSRAGVILAVCLLLLLPAPNARAAAIKVRVIVDNASIYKTTDIDSRTLANIPLDTVLDAEAKQGEWYKVALMKEGVQIFGYIHEFLVKEVAEGEAQQAFGPSGIMKSQAEIAAEIELRMTDDKNLIRQEKELERAIDDLKPLVAKAFNIDDRQKQKQIVCEIYLSLGRAYAKLGDNYSAQKEFRNMFEVDYAFAKEITNNIYDPLVSSFIEQADKQYRGLLVEYTLDIRSDPKEAMIKINGKEIGPSPEIYRTIMPKFTLEIEKPGFKTFKEEILLTQAAEKRDYNLVSIGRTLTIRSEPKEAKVILDGEDTGKSTDCELPYVSYGGHTISIVKENYADWEETIQILEGPGPIHLSVVLPVKNYVFSQKWGGLQGKIFKLPRSVAFDKEGNFYVIDGSDIKAKQFDSRGNLLSSWGDAVRESRILEEPTDIAVDSEGNAYITDAKQACVAKFAENGELISKWGKEGMKPGELSSPSGIAVDNSGDIYVADSGNNRIVKYSSHGAVKKTWGKQGARQGEFINPSAVAVNQKNEVIVVDKARVQIFSSEGEFIAAWGKAGSGDGEMKGPMGVCSDRQNYVYVADTGNNRILKFDSNGRLIAQWGTIGRTDGQMMSPFDVAVNDKGSVLVIERDNNRLQEFRVLSK
jgi:DNA-binding beta-propeller fold protein YncE